MNNNRNIPIEEHKKKKPKRHIPWFVIQDMAIEDGLAVREDPEFTHHVAIGQDRRLERCPVCGDLKPQSRMTLASLDPLSPPERVCTQCVKDFNMGVR